MRQWGIRVIVILGLCGLLLTGQHSRAERPIPAMRQAGSPVFNHYQADVRVDPSLHLVTGTVAVRFIPQDTKAYFHLYPNAFRETYQRSNPNWEWMLGKERIPGEIQIRGVRVDGNPVQARMEGADGTILEVPVPAAAKPTAVVAELEFELRVPFNSGRLSYNDHALWLGNWLPILAVKEDREWRLDPYYPMGDPFYSEMAAYDVRINLPAGYHLATTGLESTAVMTETRPERRISYEIQAGAARDFAMVIMDHTYRSTESQVGNTVVRTWWQEGDDRQIVERLHDVAVQSIRFYSEQFGSYPYKEYDVVKTGGFFGGMEYPGIVFVQGEFFNALPGTGAAVVAHETAHQWFYGLVGSDEVREAWVDESLTDYLAMAFLQQYDPILAQGYIANRLERGRAAEQYARSGITAWQPLDSFPDWKSYSDLVYSRGAAMWWEIRQSWGEKRLHQTLRQYVQEYQYGLAAGKDVVDLFTRAAGADAGPFFAYWLRLDLEKEQQAREWLRNANHWTLLRVD